MLEAERQDTTRAVPFAQQQDAFTNFAKFLRPRVAQLLQAFGLDILYHRAQGDWLYYRNHEGDEVEVLDLIGGFGASLLGHNNPELVTIGRQVFSQELPFNAQASVRGQSGCLAKALSDEVGRFTGRSYVVTLASTGTEAVEAAIKHAELEKSNSNKRLLERTKEDIRRLRIRLREGSAYLTPDFLQLAAGLLFEPGFPSLEAMLAKFEAVVRKAVEVEPRFLAISGAFHGKSTGSLQLTHREEFRSPWRRIGLRGFFVPREDEAALERELREACINYPVINYQDGGRVVLQQQTLTNISACLCEPIQGEGGVYELSSRFMKALRRAANDGNFPLVIDEIQSGMGRCGTFLASEASEVCGDYYLLSKSLGGGLAKISALLVDRDRYENEFSYLHSSTFADDDYSSAIASGVMAILGRDDGAVIKQCRQTGEALLHRLRSLQVRFPEQIQDIRGRGLMIGIELAPQLNSSSPLLRVVSEQQLLSYLASGYMLNNHNIRVAPTLANKTVIRVEPSAYISDDSCEQFCHALEQFLIHLRDDDTARLLGFIVGRRTTNPQGPINPQPSLRTTKAASSIRSTSARVAFLVHFSTISDLQNWEPRLQAFSETDCASFLHRTRGLFHPFVLHETQVNSRVGNRVHLTVIGIQFTAAQAIESMRDGSEWCLDSVKQGLELARELGCTVVGLGGHTSIVSASGRSLVEDALALTSGNSLTVAAAHESLLKAAARVGLDVGACRLGVVGAAGNLGATLAELTADQVGSMLLIGRPKGKRFLQLVAQRIYAAALGRIADGSADTGIARTMANSDVVRNALRSGKLGSERLGEELFFSLSEEMGEEAPIQLRTELEDLRSCQLVISATNAARPVVNSSHLSDGPIVVCDIAVPQDVELAVESERPNATVIRGGMVHAPLGQVLGIPAMPLRESELYGCLAETILLGFVGCQEHYSYGPLSVSRVRQVSEWAAIHGFETVMH